MIVIGIENMIVIGIGIGIRMKDLGTEGLKHALLNFTLDNKPTNHLPALNPSGKVLLDEFEP